MPPPASDDSSRKRVSIWYRGASKDLLRERQEVEKSSPWTRDKTPWNPPPEGSQPLHAWTDGSFRVSAVLGWVITADETGAGDIIAQGSESLGTRQTAFDAEVAAINAVTHWYMQNRADRPALVIHSDSTSAIARAGQTGAGPGQHCYTPWYMGYNS